MSIKDEKEREADERRKGGDRRNITRSVSFPHKTGKGLVILKDRRKAPDRRINNISVDEEEIDEKEFMKFLKDYKKFV